MRKDREKGPKKDLEPIKIAFGMVTEYTFNGKTGRHVIIELGEDNWCSTSEIMETEGNISLGIPGTATLDDIHSLTGEIWTKEQILAAYKNWFGQAGVPDCFITTFDRESQRPPRMLG